MKKHFLGMRALASFFAVIFCFLPFFQLSTHAESVTNLPDTSGASSVYLYNFESDQILLKRSGMTQIAPASTVKIMTGLIAIQQLQGRLEEYVTITSDMLAEVQGFTIHLKANMTVKLIDLLYGVICGGGNDAAIILAIVCSGSVEAFVDAMNQQALAWGCTDTHYTNPTGIDDYGMYTTLEDTVLLAKKAIETPLFVEISSASNHAYIPRGENSSLIFYNRNALISSFSAIGYQNRHVKGLNAGMTDRGGYCVVAYASNENASYLCVVMGAVESTNGILSYKIANSLLNHVFTRYAYLPIAEKGTALCSAPVTLALPQSGESEATVSCVLAEDLYGYLPTTIDPEKDLTYRYYFHHDVLTAPVTSGTVVGGVDVYLDDERIAGAKLLAAEDLSQSELLNTLATMKSLILSRTTIISVLVFVLLLLPYLYVTGTRYKKKHIKQIPYRK